MSLEKAQEELQDALTKNFLSNLEFFKHIDKNLYDRVTLLSSLIEKGEYKERYLLEFFEEEGDFDIYDIVSEKYIYNKKPKKYNNQAISSINFDKKGYFSILETNLYKNKVYEYDVNINKLQESADANILLFNNIQKYVDILKDDTTTKKKHYKSIDKFMFVGTLLGRHISKIVEKVNAKCYFIHEANLEIFRLSLFTFDYSILFKNKTRVFFSIMDDSTKFETRIFNFLNLHSWSNHTIKYHTTDYNVKNSFNNILNAIISFKPTLFNYNMQLHCVFRNMCERIDKYKLLSFPQNKFKNIFFDNPVLYICAGPSLLDNLDWLKENKHKFLIVTIGSSLKKLLENNINPNIIITLDSKYEDLNRLQFDETTCEKIQDTIIFASINTDQRILNRFNQDKLYLFDVLTTLKEDSKPLNGYSVGEVGYRIILELGSTKTYLLGTDLAINQEKGTTHSSKGSGVATTYDLNNIKDNISNGNFDLRSDLIKVKGNLKSEVYTNRSLNTSIVFYNQISQEIKKDNQKVFNLCNHGAFYINTIPTETKDVEEDSFIKLDNLVNDLNELSTIGLTIQEKERLNVELIFLDRLLDELVKLNQIKYNTYKNFKNDMIVFNNNVMQYELEFGCFFSIILSNYFSIINPYIDYCFNDLKIKNEDKKIDKISKLWIVNIIDLLEEYKKYLLKIKAT